MREKKSNAKDILVAMHWEDFVEMREGVGGERKRDE